MGTTIAQLKTEMEEQIHDEAQDMYDSRDPEDRIHEYADSTVPVYNADRLECLTDDNSLAYLDDTGLVADDADIYTRIGVAIYEQLLQHGYTYWEEIKSEIADALDEIDMLDADDLIADDNVTLDRLANEHPGEFSAEERELLRAATEHTNDPEWKEENEDEIEEARDSALDAYRKIRIADYWEEF